MAAPNLTTHSPIIVVQTISGNQEWIKSSIDAASQTFLAGSALQLNGSGQSKNWDGTTITRGIAGVSLLPGLNLASAGLGASPIFGSVRVSWRHSDSGFGSEPVERGQLGSRRDVYARNQPLCRRLTGCDL